MTTFHLAQLNIARMTVPLDNPAMTDFVDNLDRINALAESAPGFVWRLKDDTEAGAGNATSFRPFGDDMLVNLSVWTDPEALRDFAFRSDHVEYLRRRREWFAAMDEAYAVLWWVPAGHQPTLDEAAARLQALRTHGASDQAFGFRDVRPPPENPPLAADQRTALR